MGRTRKRKRSVGNSREDRISKLPEALLHHILSFLTTVEVVQTCVLSKRWRYVWAYLPFFHFDYNTFPIYKSDKMVSFTNFINQVLLRHNCSHIVKFSFNSEDDLLPDATLIESWICYATKHHVQELDISACCAEQSIVLPRFFSCQSLTTLTLVCYPGVIELPSSFGLSSLKTLHLSGFLKLDGNIFSSCPILETLILEDIFVENLNIYALNLKVLKFLSRCACKVMIFAPKLTHFKFDGDYPLVCHVNSLASLDEVTVKLHLNRAACFIIDGWKEKLGLRLINMLNELHNAKSITLSLDAIEVLSVVPAALNEHPSAFRNLKCLKLKSDKQCKDFNVPSCILTYFLNSSTSLIVCS